MRTKDEISAILSKRKLPDALTASTWGDLVASIQVFTNEEKTQFVALIANGNARKAGERIKRALHANARGRAVAEIDIMLANDSLSLTELDALI